MTENCDKLELAAIEAAGEEEEMSCKINLDAYKKLIAEDLAVLDTLPHSLEVEHIKQVVYHSIAFNYPDYHHPMLWHRLADEKPTKAGFYAVWFVGTWLKAHWNGNRFSDNFEWWLELTPPEREE
jgi:hypothetical protein